MCPVKLFGDEEILDFWGTTRLKKKFKAFINFLLLHLPTEIDRTLFLEVCAFLFPNGKSIGVNNSENILDTCLFKRTGEKMNDSTFLILVTGIERCLRFLETEGFLIRDIDSASSTFIVIPKPRMPTTS